VNFGLLHLFHSVSEVCYVFPFASMLSLLAVQLEGMWPVKNLTSAFLKELLNVPRFLADLPSL